MRHFKMTFRLGIHYIECSYSYVQKNTRMLSLRDQDLYDDLLLAWTGASIAWALPSTATSSTKQDLVQISNYWTYQWFAPVCVRWVVTFTTSLKLTPMIFPMSTWPTFLWYISGVWLFFEPRYLLTSMRMWDDGHLSDVIASRVKRTELEILTAAFYAPSCSSVNFWQRFLPPELV